MCDNRDSILEALGASYAEAPVAVGATNAGDVLIEVLSSADGTTWTIIMTKTDGTSCLVAAGTDWQIREWKQPIVAGAPL